MVSVVCVFVAIEPFGSSTVMLLTNKPSPLLLVTSVHAASTKCMPATCKKILYSKNFEILRAIALIGSPRSPRAILFSDWVLFVLDETRDFVVRRNGLTVFFCRIKILVCNKSLFL